MYNYHNYILISKQFSQVTLKRDNLYRCRNSAAQSQGFYDTVGYMKVIIDSADYQ